MNTPPPIVLKDFSLVSISAAEVARGRRDMLLQNASSLAPIVDAESARQATALLRDLRGFYKTIEDGRQEVKAPVLKLERDIDALARELSGDVETQGRRVSLLLGAWDIEQKRLVEEKRQEAQREERRIREEAARAEYEAEQARQKADREAEAERARQQATIDAEAAAKAARARTDAGRERAAREAEQAKQALQEQALVDAKVREAKAFAEQQARDDEEARRVAATREAAVALTSSKPKDTTTKEVIKWEVTDIVALYEAAPYLVRLEPNAAALNSALKGLHGEQKLPGVKHWKEATTITRG